MADLLVKEAELQQLQGMINELPTKFGVPLLNFFNGVANLRAQEAQAKAADDAKPKSLSPTAEPKSDVSETSGSQE